MIIKCNGCREVSYTAPEGQVFLPTPHVRCRRHGIVPLLVQAVAACNPFYNTVEIVGVELPPACAKEAA